MRLLGLAEVIELHRRIVEESGGIQGIRDFGALESVLAQPRMSFGGQDLYPTVVEKAAALGSSIVQNHPFLDGNKRVGHASMEVMLVLNGFELSAPIEEQEAIVLSLAAGEVAQKATKLLLDLQGAPKVAKDLNGFAGLLLTTADNMYGIRLSPSSLI